MLDNDIYMITLCKHIFKDLVYNRIYLQLFSIISNFTFNAKQISMPTN